MLTRGDEILHLNENFAWNFLGEAAKYYLADFFRHGKIILPKRLGGKGDIKNGIDLCIMSLGSFDIKHSTPSVEGVE